jgi:hypothetical protein
LTPALAPERNCVCQTARPSVKLMRSPRNMASMRPRKSQSSAKAGSKTIVSVVIRFFE